MSDSDSDNGGVALSQDSLAALQSVLGGAGLEELLHSNRVMMEQESSDDEDDDNNDIIEEGSGLRSGESHADYYKRLYPERYNTNDAKDGISSSSKDMDDSSSDQIGFLPIEHPVAIVSMDDEYVQDIIVDAFQKYYPNWKVMTKPPSLSSTKEGNNAEDCDAIRSEQGDSAYHFHWGDYEYIDWFSPLFMSEQILVSCYYNRKGLIRKGHLAQILENWHVKKGYDSQDAGNGDETSSIKRFAPKSHVIQLPRSLLEDDTDSKMSNTPSADFINGLQQAIVSSGFGFDNNEPSSGNTGTTIVNGTETWILKPSVTNQAQGMCLIQTEEQIQEAIYKSDPVQRAGDFVLQQYLPPLLLRGQKFHLRVFMVVCGNIQAYVHPDFLAIFSLEQYEEADITDTRAHFTNIAHQEVLSIQDQHDCMRLFEETKQDMIDGGLVRTMEEASARIHGIKQRVYDIAGETMEAVSSELTFTSKKNCFEIFGLDFMIDPAWNAWLLEANAEPDLSKAGSRLQPIIDSLIVDTLHLVVSEDGRFNTKNETVGIETSFVKVFERKGRSF